MRVKVRVHPLLRQQAAQGGAQGKALRMGVSGHMLLAGALRSAALICEQSAQHAVVRITITSRRISLVPTRQVLGRAEQAPDLREPLPA